MCPTVSMPWWQCGHSRCSRASPSQRPVSSLPQWEPVRHCASCRRQAPAPLAHVDDVGCARGQAGGVQAAAVHAGCVVLQFVGAIAGRRRVQHFMLPVSAEQGGGAQRFDDVLHRTHRACGGGVGWMGDTGWVGEACRLDRCSYMPAI
jgi:hypothetical protein